MWITDAHNNTYTLTDDFFQRSQDEEFASIEAKKVCEYQKI